jgi:hypothetical protein
MRGRKGSDGDDGGHAKKKKREKEMLLIDWLFFSVALE